MGVTNPFTEDFSGGASGWKNFNGSADLAALASGGPDGGAYASGSFNFVSQASGATPVIVRGEAGASGNALQGNWIDAGVTQLSVWVRHNAPTPLTYFSRVSVTPAPGAVAISFAPVMPNTWTQLQFAIDASSPQFISFEFGDFASVFSNVGRVQFGVSVPASLAGVDQGYTFDFDKVSFVPAPGAVGVVGLGLVAVGRRRRFR
jgi:hypothetical protein